MNAPFPYEYTHTFPGDEVAVEAMRLIGILVAAGEDPVGLIEDDFVQVVARQAMADRVCRAYDLGLDLGSPRMELSEQGDMDLVFAFEREVDAAAFKIAIL
ncbi:hypothetical protein CFIICLFH_4847 [Methylobacterium goesingense]|nr:hypothetical protein CFIICLFH_4847 [Methylobacterium goesingense]